MIEKIQLINIEPFWIETSVDNLKQLIYTFDKERGKYGFPPQTTLEKSKVIKEFVAYCPGTTLKYRTELHMRLKLKQRSSEWLVRELKAYNPKMEYHPNSVRRWVNGTSKPPSAVVKDLDQVLLAR